MDHPVDIALLTGAPRAVSVAGEIYMVAPLRPLDLGELQAWIKDRVPHPVDAIKASLEAMDPIERRAAERAAVVAGRDWPPAVGSRDGAMLLLTEGLGKFLEVVLRRHRPGFTEADGWQLAARMTQAEFLTLADRAFGREGELPHEPRSNGKRDRVQGWGEVFEAVHKLTGWTYAAIAEMSLPAIEAKLNGGKRRRGEVFRSQAEVEAAVRRWRGVGLGGG